MESGELLIVAYALSLALAAKNECIQITPGKTFWNATQAKLIGRLAYCSSSDNEVTWLLSRLCEKPEETKATVQPHVDRLKSEMDAFTGAAALLLSSRWPCILGKANHRFHRSHQLPWQPQSRRSPGYRSFWYFPKSLCIWWMIEEASTACLSNHSPDANCEFASVKLRDGSKVPEILAVTTIRAVREGEELNVCYSQEMHAENQWGIRER